jgi:hypothetical protein
LLKNRRVGGSRIVAYEVEVAAILSCDAEGLLHKTIWLISVPVGALLSIVLIAILAALCPLESLVVDSGQLFPIGLRVRKPASLSFHLPVREEAARYSARTPGLAISPSPHSRFALIPHKN